MWLWGLWVSISLTGCCLKTPAAWWRKGWEVEWEIGGGREYDTSPFPERSPLLLTADELIPGVS